MSFVFDSLRAAGLQALRASHQWLDLEGGEVAALQRHLGALVARYGEAILTPATKVEQMFAGKWAMTGFTTVNIGHRHAAALMATSIPPEELQPRVRLPWPAFAVRLPTGLLGVDGLDGQRSEAVLLTVFETSLTTGNQPCVAYTVWTEATPNSPIHLTLWGVVPIAKLLDLDLPYIDRESSYEKSDVDFRTDLMTRRLLVGLCLELSDPESLRERRVSTVAKHRAKQRPADSLPDYRLFELRRSINVDVTAAIRAYCLQGDRHPTVQSLVRGHWKQQPHGPQRSLRRLIHVEPYFRGPLEAPVGARNS